MNIMENDTFKFLGFSFTNSEALKIIKEINQSIDNPQCLTTLEEFAVSCEYYDGIIYIEWEDYVYNYFIHLEEHLFENITYETINYNDFISIAEIIVRHTKYTALELKKSFEDLLLSILLNSKEDDLENELEDDHNLENELKNRYGYRNIQFCLSEEFDSLEVRYERTTYKNDVEVLTDTYDDLKKELITSIIEEIKDYVKSELDSLTKDYKECGTDENLTKEQKQDTLYNSYKLINQALKISNIPQQVSDKIILLQNDMLSAQRYQTELLKQLKKYGLNQVSINSEGKRYYTNLYHYLVKYFELLSGLAIRLKELKYLDDGISAKYHITISDEDMERWFQFYRNFAKDRYKNVSLHSVFFSYLHNTENIQPALYKKIFKTSKLQNNILPINTLPLTA